MSREVGIGVQDVKIVAELRTDADDATLAKLAELTERYCVVGQSLAQTPSLAIADARRSDQNASKALKGLAPR